MTEIFIRNILNKIESKDPKHASKIRENIKDFGNDFLIKSNSFYKKYTVYLEKEGKTLDYGVDCYLHMIEDMIEERMEFIRNGSYSSNSFAEVEKRVYANPDIMKYHMHGLVLAQFLWPDQFERFSFFSQNLKEHAYYINKYLEIGGGHGLYISEAIDLLPKANQFDLVDISSSSLELAKGIIENNKVNYFYKNIFDFEEKVKLYDFITMGEVLEHVEDPLALLIKVKNLLNAKGICFITTPVNAPMIDHIYLFNNVEEIKALFNLAGLDIIDEKIAISDNKTVKYAKKYKIPVMYAAFVKTK